MTRQTAPVESVSSEARRDTTGGPRRIDYEQAHLIASAFNEAPCGPHSPTVRAAYHDLSVQTTRWFALLTGTTVPRPIRVVYTRCAEPYPQARDLSESVRVDRLLEVSPASHDRHRRHPLLDTSVGGTYDRFRAVHDIVSHGWRRFEFDRHGEFSAWLAEDRMYAGLARWALATELHGEHSVRWTSGSLADHKAVLLEPAFLAGSMKYATNRDDDPTRALDVDHRRSGHGS